MDLGQGWYRCIFWSNIIPGGVIKTGQTHFSWRPSTFIHMLSQRFWEENEGRRDSMYVEKILQLNIWCWPFCAGFILTNKLKHVFHRFVNSYTPFLILPSINSTTSSLRYFNNYHNTSIVNFSMYVIEEISSTNVFFIVATLTVRSTAFFECSDSLDIVTDQTIKNFKYCVCRLQDSPFHHLHSQSCMFLTKIKIPLYLWVHIRWKCWANTWIKDIKAYFLK